MKGTQTDLILLDFSKALSFDEVSRLKLLYKLKMYGIDGSTLKWIQSFLSGRTHSMVSVLRNCQSLQAFPKGLIFFLLYINDLPENIQSHKFVCLQMILQCT